MNALLSLLSALAMTLLIEVPLGALILKSRSAVAPFIWINLLTNPALNAILMTLLSVTQSNTVYWIALVIGEAAVFVGEGFLIRFLCGVTLKRSMLISTEINAASLFLGSAVLALI